MTNKFSKDVLSKIPWPLTQQYELIYYWLEQKQPIYAMLHLRDTWETLIKLLATLAIAFDIQAIKNGKTIATDSAIFNLVTNGNIPTGAWVNILVESCKSKNNPIIQTLIPVINTKNWIEDNLRDFVSWRNERLGHGICSQEKDIYYQDTLKYLSKLEECLKILLPFFKKILIFSETSDQPILQWTQNNFLFSPQKAVYPFHIHIINNSDEILPVYVKLQEEKLPLSPILSIQQCESCNEYSAFFFHGYDSERDKNPVTFLEFIVKGGLKKKKDPFLIQLANHTSVNTNISKETSRVSHPDNTLEDDDDKNICIKYLIKHIKNFIDSHDRGIISLVGIGGIGKSWFCRKLGRYINKDCIYVSLQSQSNISELLGTIEKFCQNRKRWIFPKNLIDLKKQKNLIPQLLERLKENCPRKKLILILDGLDEVTEKSGIVNFFKCSGKNLPQNCFVLIAYRPNLKDNATRVMDEMISNQQYSLHLEMTVEKMAESIIEYISNQNLPKEWTQEILTKSEGIFLYVQHYCYLLSLKIFDSKSLPDKKEIYTFCFDYLKKRIGEEFFNTCYEPILTTLSIVKEPVSLEQLSLWDIREDNARIAIEDIDHFLEKDTSQQTLHYSIRHQELVDFFEEQEEWRKKCQKQEELILTWSRKKLEELVRTQEKKADESELYAIKYASSHWIHIAQQDIKIAYNIWPIEHIEKTIQEIEKLGISDENSNIGNILQELGKIYELYSQYENKEENTKKPILYEKEMRQKKAIEYYKKSSEYYKKKTQYYKPTKEENKITHNDNQTEESKKNFKSLLPRASDKKSSSSLKKKNIKLRLLISFLCFLVAISAVMLLSNIIVKMLSKNTAEIPNKTVEIPKIELVVVPQIQVICEYREPGQKIWKILENNDNMPSLSQYRFKIMIPTKGTLLAKQHDSAGITKPVFPNNVTSYQNPLEPGIYTLPSEDKAFKLSATPADETIEFNFQPESNNGQDNVPHEQTKIMIFRFSHQ